MLESLDYSFDEIVITEIWETTYTTDLLNIPNYTRVSNMRSDGRMGGGVALFIKNCIGFKINEAYNLTTAEAVFVDILGYNNKTTLIGAIYRPPSGMLSKFNLKFTELLDNISALNNECVLAGDYTIDLLKQTNTETAAFTELLQSYLTTPMITIPTRCSDDKCH